MIRQFEVEWSNLDTKDKIVDVPQMITRKIVKALDKCEREGKPVNWKQLKEYVMEYFLVADYRAERCIKDAREISVYMKYTYENILKKVQKDNEKEKDGK